MKNQHDDKSKNAKSTNTSNSPTSNGQPGPAQGNAERLGGPNLTESGLGDIAASGSTDTAEELKHGHKNDKSASPKS